MRRLAISIALIVLGVTSSFASGHKVIASDELDQMMKEAAQITIVDVREPELFNEGHIPGAINIPYEVAHKRVLKELKKEETIVFVCHGGPMGDELSDILVRNGYKSVYNLRGGMRKWKGALEK